MQIRKILETDIISVEHYDFSKWPIVLPDGFKHEDQDRYYRRKQAVEMYLIGEIPIREIVEKTKICIPEIYRYVKRCTEIDENGNVWGYRALIPDKRLKNYTRWIPSSSSTVKLTGAFEKLLNSYPVIRDEIEDLYLQRLKKNRELAEPVIKPKYVWKKFLNACRQNGIQANEYPFITKDLGKRSVERYLQKLNNIYFEESVKRFGEDAARHARNTGIGEQNFSINTRPFKTVEFDGHRIDAIFALEITTPEGDTIVKILERLWVLTIIDESTRAILGYYISLNQEYTADDVRSCVRSAMVPWEPKSFSIPALRYSDAAGFPSGIPELQWVVWDELKYDNAKANLAQSVISRLNRFGCSVNAGPVKVPERRRLIERFFKTLEETGFHRLPNTTGNSITDVRRNRAEEKAIKYQISLEHLLELTEVLIANYNGTPHAGINYLTPLEAIRSRLDPKLARIIPKEKREELLFLTVQAKRKVSGNIKTGKRPYIQYESVTYRNEILARTPELIGQTLTLLINTEDLRMVRAFLPDGGELGMMTAVGKWGISKHSLKTRKAINGLRQRKLLQFTSEDDPIEAYRNYLISLCNSSKSKTALTQLAKLNSDQQKIDEFETKWQKIDSYDTLPQDEHYLTKSVNKIIEQKNTEKVIQEESKSVPLKRKITFTH